MAIVSIFATLVFSTVLCIIEIPKMLNKKLYREFGSFIVLLGIGTVLAILKSLEVKIPNPSDFVAWVYSPLTDIMKSFLE